MLKLTWSTFHSHIQCLIYFIIYFIICLSWCILNFIETMLLGSVMPHQSRNVRRSSKLPNPHPPSRFKCFRVFQNLEIENSLVNLREVLKTSFQSSSEYENINGSSEYENVNGSSEYENVMDLQNMNILVDLQDMNILGDVDKKKLDDVKKKNM